MAKQDELNVLTNEAEIDRLRIALQKVRKLHTAHYTGLANHVGTVLRIIDAAIEQKRTENPEGES